MEKQTTNNYKRVVNNSFCSGDMYGKLMLTGKSYIDRGHKTVEYICDCGAIKWVRLESLISGNTKSCGCLTKSFLSETSTKHGLHNHTLYGIFYGLIERCYNKDRKEYPDYGGRGITICDEWLNDFKVFYDWAINNGWVKKLTLEREDNDGNYTPDNCKWATMKEQSRNRRSNINITAFGETKCATDWALDERCKTGVYGIYSRIKKGWDAESAIALPNVHINRHLIKEIKYK